jgi:murein DD-endopeptidase MepM/ murein hydrolase activator NlpD
MGRLRQIILVIGVVATVPGGVRGQKLTLPTGNDAFLRGNPSGFYQYVDRNFEGQASSPWQGGQFGFVRNPRRLGGGLLYTRFHEGLDIKPLNRAGNGDPLDEVRAMADGVVVHVSATSSHSNYGRYVVVRHDWSDGPFYSLYAHLRTIAVSAGEKVRAGRSLGILGYTGVGINQRRAHVHVELNVFLSSRFETWHDACFSSPNYHGVYNGLNMIGLDLASLFEAQQRSSSTSAADIIEKTEAYFTVAVPGHARMEIAKNYRWLRSGISLRRPASWEITFSRWGLPLKVRPGSREVSEPQIVSVAKSSVPHSYNTRGLLSGSGQSASLSQSGRRFVLLAAGLH